MKTKEEIISLYPEIFQENFYFSIHSGWLDIVDNLCSNIVKRIKESDNSSVTVDQVKQKFGTLRFYVSIISDDEQFKKDIYKLISDAEVTTEKFCEFCGANAELNRNGRWWFTLCNLCLNSKNNH